MKIGPKYKICRRLGSRVFPKCETTKFTISGSGSSDRSGGQRRNLVLSEYGSQLLEKQKARYAYGLKEGQLRNYVSLIQRRRSADSATLLYHLLESRLDNVVFRLGWAPSRAAARQLVTHGHITVNKRRVNIPSFHLRSGDEIGIREGSKTIAVFHDLKERMLERQTPTWLRVDPDKLTGRIIGAPVLGETEADLNFGSILEFYSRV